MMIPIPGLVIRPVRLIGMASGGEVLMIPIRVPGGPAIGGKPLMIPVVGGVIGSVLSISLVSWGEVSIPVLERVRRPMLPEGLVPGGKPLMVAVIEGVGGSTMPEGIVH